MLELLLFFGAPLEEPNTTAIRDYAVENLYTEDYQMCSLGSFVDFFEQPLKCVDRDFITYAAETIGFKVSAIEVISEQLIRTTLLLNDSSKLEILSTVKSGHYVLMRLTINHNSQDSYEVISAITSKIEKDYGLLSQNDSHSMQIDENLDLHLTQDSTSTSFTFIKRDAYHLL